MSTEEASARVAKLKALLVKSGVSPLLESGAASFASGGEDPPARTIRAFFDSALLIAVADDKITEREYEHLVALLTDLSAGGLPIEQIDTLINDRFDAAARDGIERCAIRVSHSLSSAEERAAAFTTAVGMAYADGRIQATETETFELLRRAFEMTSDETTRILAEVHALLATTKPRK